MVNKQKRLTSMSVLVWISCKESDLVSCDVVNTMPNVPSLKEI